METKINNNKTTLDNYYNNRKIDFTNGLIDTTNIDELIKYLHTCLHKQYVYNLYKNENGLINFEILISDDYTISNINKINNICIIHGYSIYHILYENNKINFNDIDKNKVYKDFSIIIVPKFDKSIIINTPIYYVVHESKINTILENGIIPWHECKLTTHFFDLTYICTSIVDCIKLIPIYIKTSGYYNLDKNGKKTTKNKNFAILEILNTKDLVLYEGNFFDFNNGYYTYRNICKNNIKLIKIVYDNNLNDN